MNSPLNLLVVEDRDCHFGDFAAMLSAIESKLPIEIRVTRALDLTAATPLIDGADAVITDLFFPDSPGGEEKPNGRKIVQVCFEKTKPVVWITSTNHHGPKTNEHSRWGREHGLEMFDCDLPTTEELEGDHKPWLEALFGVIALTVGMEMGQYKIEGGELLTTCCHVERSRFVRLGSELNEVARSLAMSNGNVTLALLRLDLARVHEQ